MTESEMRARRAAEREARQARSTSSRAYDASRAIAQRREADRARRALRTR